MSRPKRGDLQGLRAIAVAVVVIYHYFPQWLPGGFVGVDVFFVISGYLIIGLLVREASRTGRVDLPAFYGRRVRRLLPASLVVVMASCVVGAVVLDPIRLTEVFGDAAWTSTYLANYHFAQAPTGYFDTGEPSPLLHFWSLAVEEQFYVVWPLILLGLLKIGGHLRRLVGVTLGVLTAASFSMCLWLTFAGTSDGYYALASRAWELIVGGFVAVALAPRPPRGRASLLMSVAGLGLVLGSCAVISERTPFPGWAALAPVAGAALLIAAGSGTASGPVQRLLSVPIARYVGDISYSLYLWHWPVLILGLARAKDTTAHRLLLAALAFLLAALSYRFIERPTAVARPSLSGRVLVAGGLATAVAAAALTTTAGHLVPTSADTAASGAVTRGGLKLASTGAVLRFADAGPGEAPDRVPANVTPALADLSTDLASVFDNGCFGMEPSRALTSPSCAGGDTHADTLVILAGDSMAGAWWPAIDLAAKKRGWHLVMVGHNGCPLADVRIAAPKTSAAPWPDCDTWQRKATAAIVAARPDLVIWASHANGYRLTGRLRQGFDAWQPGASRTLSALTGAAPVFLIGQTPIFPEQPARCLASHLTDVVACSRSRAEVLSPEVSTVNQALARATGAVYFDPADLVCSATCPIMAAQYVMYRDDAHLTATYAEQLADHLGVMADAARRMPR